MKRLLLVVAVLAASALGYAAAKPGDLPISVSALKWLSEPLRADCGKSEFEWRLMSGKIAPERLKLSVSLDILEILPAVKSNGLVVRVNTTGRPGYPWPPKDPRTIPGTIGTDSGHAMGLVRQRFGDASMFEDGKNLYLLFCIDGQLVAVRTLNFYKMLPPGSSQAQQEAAAAELLTH